jgi:hypothetical protein
VRADKAADNAVRVLVEAEDKVVVREAEVVEHSVPVVTNQSPERFGEDCSVGASHREESGVN